MKKNFIITSVILLLVIGVYYYFLMAGRVTKNFGDYLIHDKFYPPMCGIITVEKDGKWFNKKIGSFKICEENVQNVYEKDGWVNVEIGCGQVWRKELKTGKVDIYTPENKCFHRIILN